MILDIDTTALHKPSRLRKAICEFTGGHNNQVFEAKDCHGTRALRLFCNRCGKLTKWYNVTRTETHDEKNSHILDVRVLELAGPLKARFLSTENKWAVMYPSIEEMETERFDTQEEARAFIASFPKSAADGGSNDA